MPTRIGYALITPDRKRVWCAPGLFPWQRLPRAPALWESRPAALRAARALHATLTLTLIVLPLSAP